jgi:hypothetical protein
MSRRSLLLPPYLASNPAWQQLIEAIDLVFQDELDLPTHLLSRMRDNWILADTAAEKIDAHVILDSDTNFFSVERETLIRQANMLGFLFKEADLLTDADYRRIVRNLGDYWFAKGTPKFIDFLSFCLNSAIRVVKLFSTPGATYETYGPMKEEGDAAIGTLNWQGGQWFETSHVDLIADPEQFSTSDVPKLIALFNALANYDLVLDSIVFEAIAFIHSPGDAIGVINKAYPMVDVRELLLTTDIAVGVDGPPVYLTSPLIYDVPPGYDRTLRMAYTFESASSVFEYAEWFIDGAYSSPSVFGPTVAMERFTPRFFALDGPRSMSFALTTSNRDMSVDWTARKNNDLCGIIWNSEDQLDAVSIGYAQNNDYRHLIWTFNVEVSPTAPVLNDPAKALSLTIEGYNEVGDAVTYIVALFNYASAPATRSSSITLNFDSIKAGFFADQPMYLGNVMRLFIGAVSSSYTGADTPLSSAENGYLRITNSVCSGPNSTVDLNTVSVSANSLGMSTSYDDMYNISPERAINNIVQLGYTGWINHYVGMSIFPEKVWDVTDSRFKVPLVTDGLPLISGPASIWHTNFLTRAHAAGFDVIQAVSYEQFSLHARYEWVQREWSDALATTNYTPDPSYVLSPGVADAMSYLRACFVQFSNLAASVAGMSVYMQVGEPWWWYNTGTQNPCIYDYPTKLAFNTATGLFAEDLGVIFSEVPITTFLTESSMFTDAAFDEVRTFISNNGTAYVTNATWAMIAGLGDSDPNALVIVNNRLRRPTAAEEPTHTGGVSGAWLNEVNLAVDAFRLVFILTSGNDLADWDVRIYQNGVNPTSDDLLFSLGGLATDNIKIRNGAGYSTYTHTWTPNTECAIELTVRDKVMTVTINSAPLMTGLLPAQTAGKLGLAMYEGTGAVGGGAWLNSIVMYNSVGDQYIKFVRNMLGVSVLSMRTAILAAHPTAKVSALPFLPSIFDHGFMKQVNWPIAQYSYPNLDFFQVEAYDWVINTTNDPTGYAKPDTAVRVYAIEQLGYPANKVHYIGGFVDAAYGYTTEQMWSSIFRNLRAQVRASATTPFKQYLWAYPQVMRDDIVFRPEDNFDFYYTSHRYTTTNGSKSRYLPGMALGFEMPSAYAGKTVSARSTLANWHGETWEAATNAVVRGEITDLDALRAAAKGITLTNSTHPIGPVDADHVVYSRLGVDSGKWYWEVSGFVAPLNHSVGVSYRNIAEPMLGTDYSSWVFNFNGTGMFNGVPCTIGSPVTSTSDVIGVALDMDGGRLDFYKNGVLQVNSLEQGTFSVGRGYDQTKVYAAFSGFAAAGYCTVNFGATAFAYSPPAGYRAGLLGLKDANEYCLVNASANNGMWSPVVNATAPVWDAVVPRRCVLKPGQWATSDISHNTGKWYFEIETNAVFSNASLVPSPTDGASVDHTASEGWFFGGIAAGLDLSIPTNEARRLLYYQDIPLATTGEEFVFIEGSGPQLARGTALGVSPLRVGFAIDFDTGSIGTYLKNGSNDHTVGGIEPFSFLPGVAAVRLEKLPADFPTYFMQVTFGLLAGDMQITGGIPAGYSAWGTAATLGATPAPIAPPPGPPVPSPMPAHPFFPLPPSEGGVVGIDLSGLWDETPFEYRPPVPAPFPNPALDHPDRFPIPVFLPPSPNPPPPPPEYPPSLPPPPVAPPPGPALAIDPVSANAVFQIGDAGINIGLFSDSHFCVYITTGTDNTAAVSQNDNVSYAPRTLPGSLPSADALFGTYPGYTYLWKNGVCFKGDYGNIWNGPQTVPGVTSSPTGLATNSGSGNRAVAVFSGEGGKMALQPLGLTTWGVITPFGTDVNWLTVQFANTLKMYAVGVNSLDQTFMVESSSGGQFWSITCPDIAPGRVLGVKWLKVLDNSMLIAGPNMAPWYSNNGGLTWAELPAMLPTNAVGTTASYGQAYIYSENAGDNRLLRSTDGQNWKELRPYRHVLGTSYSSPGEANRGSSNSIYFSAFPSKMCRLYFF